MESDIIQRLQSHMGKADIGEVLADCRIAAAHIEAQALRIAELEAEVIGCQGRLDAAIEGLQDARKNAIEEAAKLIDEGFDRPGIVKKQDQCAHGKFGWEDCESCAAAAIRSLIPPEKMEGYMSHGIQPANESLAWYLEIPQWRCRRGCWSNCTERRCCGHGETGPCCEECGGDGGFEEAGSERWQRCEACAGYGMQYDWPEAGSRKEGEPK